MKQRHRYIGLAQHFNQCVTFILPFKALSYLYIAGAHWGLTPSILLFFSFATYQSTTSTSIETQKTYSTAYVWLPSFLAFLIEFKILCSRTKHCYVLQTYLHVTLILGEWNVGIDSVLKCIVLHDTLSFHCTKMKHKYPGYELCHLASVMSFGAVTPNGV